jgi:hypothetical protein
VVARVGCRSALALGVVGLTLADNAALLERYSMWARAQPGD